MGGRTGVKSLEFVDVLGQFGDLAAWHTTPSLIYHETSDVQFRCHNVNEKEITPKLIRVVGMLHWLGVRKMGVSQRITSTGGKI